MSALGSAECRARVAGTAPKPSGATAPSPPTPRPDPTPTWPDPPAGEAFVGLAGEIIRTVEPDTEADPAALLVQLLVMFGNVVGRGPHFTVEGDRHYTNEFVVVVGATASGRKGTSFGRVREVFAAADRGWIDTRVRGGVSSGEGLLWNVRDPLPRRGKGDGDPGEPDKRLMLHEPEFASVLKQTERQGNTASPVLRQLWDGKEVVASLAKNEPATATGPHVSMIGHVTPEELSRYLTATESANGFGNRFLMACARRSKLLPDGGKSNPAVMDPLRVRLAAAVASARGTGEVQRHPATKDLWYAVYPILTADRPGLYGALTGRAAPHVLRLAMLYAMLDRSTDIRPQHLMAGVAVWDYCERSVLFVFGGRTGNPVSDDIRGALVAAGDGGLTRDDLREHFHRNRSAGEMATALGLLERSGLARPEKVSTGGRPAERWFASDGAGDGPSTLLATARRVYAVNAESPPGGCTR